MPQVIMIAAMDEIVRCDASDGQEMVTTLETSIDTDDDAGRMLRTC